MTRLARGVCTLRRFRTIADRPFPKFELLGQVWRVMALKSLVCKLLLAFFLGFRATLGTGMSREEIEEILFSSNQTRVEVTIPEEKVQFPQL